jgi:hypothetical protein
MLEANKLNNTEESKTTMLLDQTSKRFIKMTDKVIVMS